MGKINIPNNDTQQATNVGYSAYSFNSLGQPIYIDEYGVKTIIGSSQDNIQNIIANIGVGLESDIPDTAVQGDVYVTTDTLKKYTKLDATTWNISDLIEKQFITDTSGTSAIQYQYNGVSIYPFSSFEEISIGTSTLRYNTERQVLEIVYDNGQVQQVGREGTTIFYNNTGSTIPNGTPLTMSGAITVGDISVITVLPADAISIATAKVCGHSTIDAPSGELSIMTWKGDINGIDTSGFAQGNKLFLAVGGGYTDTPPSSPNIVVELARVLTIDATEGSIHVCFPVFSATSNTSTSTQSYLFLSNVDSSISGFKTLSKDIDAVETEKTITVNSGTSPVAGEKYLSEPLNLTVLPASILEGYGFLKVDSTVGETKIDFRVYIYHEDTTTTLLVDDLSGEINNTTYTPYRFSLPFMEQTLVETDRLLVEVLGITGHAGDKTINYIVGDGRASYISLPLPIDHTTTINQNGDENFQHLTTEQVGLVNNSVQTDSNAKLNSATTGVIYDNGNSGTSKTITASNSTSQKITLDANCEVTLAAVTGSTRFSLKVIQDATGGRNMTFTNTVQNPSEFNFADGGANQKTNVTFFYDGEEWWISAFPYID